MEGVDPLFGAFVEHVYWLGREESRLITEEGFVGGHF